ncbi:MAG: MtrAB system histidine kinase MtrB [Ornithinimicrobium sp.]
MASTFAGAARSIRSWLLAWWRSSLRLRVIAATLIAGTILAAILGTLLYQRVAVGLVEQAVARAEADAAQQVQQAQELFDATDRRDDFGLTQAAQDTVNQVVSGGQGDNRRAVLVQSLDSDRDSLISPVTFGNLDVSDIPAQLREALQQTPGLQQVVVTQILGPQAEVDQTAVSVASRVQIPRAGPYDLVLVYPLDREQEILDLIREWFLIGGVGLALLVSALAWLAARLVTGPVGQAAAVSQDLARGELDERMDVNGTDELARLATSFNTMADSLQHQIQQLEQLSLVQQRFVSDVSHELRTPLTTIRMAGEVLHASREDFSAPVSRSAELLYSELDRFEDLLTELLEISRYDSGTTVMESQPGDIIGLSHAVVESVQPFADREGSQIRVMASPPIIVEMDSRRVSRVLRNLLMNAVEHGEAKPIDVAFHHDDDVVAVAVRDHGIGLAAEQREQVFERFWRADAARTRTTGGTGLGLAIAREDAHLHGGRLEAAGRPGEGACFRLTLPRHTGVVLPAPDTERAPSIEELFGDGNGDCEVAQRSLATEGQS